MGISIFNRLGNFAGHPYVAWCLSTSNAARPQLTGLPKLLWDEQDKLGKAGGMARSKFERTSQMNAMLTR